MNDEQIREELEILVRAIEIANKFGPLILNDAEHIGGTAATSVAIMFSQYSAAMGMSLHDAISLFMAVHKQTMAMKHGK